MAFNPEINAGSADDLQHPLFADLDGEAVSLEGHLTRGVTAVLAEVARARGLDVTDRLVRLVNDPAELEVAGGAVQ